MFHFYVLLSLPWSVTGKEHFYSLSASFATLSFALTALSGININKQKNAAPDLTDAAFFKRFPAFS